MKLKVIEIIEAIEKNGWPQIRGQMLDFDEYAEPRAACAWGQAYLNLKDKLYAHWTPNAFAVAINGAQDRSSLRYLELITRTVIGLNDNDFMTTTEIGAYLREHYSSFLEVELDIG